MSKRDQGLQSVEERKGGGEPRKKKGKASTDFKKEGEAAASYGKETEENIVQLIKQRAYEGPSGERGISSSSQKVLR